MAFVSVPKDLNKVKTKVALNLTKRQIICFSIAGIIGLPVYWFSRKAIGDDMAIFLMIAIASPFFFTGIFEKDGMGLEKYARLIVNQKFIYPKVRLYKTENFYEYIKNEYRRELEHEKSANEKARKQASKQSKSASRKQKERSKKGKNKSSQKSIKKQKKSA